MYFLVFSIFLLLIFIVFVFSVNPSRIIFVSSVLMVRPISWLSTLMSSSILLSSLAECEKRIWSPAYRRWDRYSPSILIPLSPYSVVLITSLFEVILKKMRIIVSPCRTPFLSLKHFMSISVLTTDFALL